MSASFSRAAGQHLILHLRVCGLVCWCSLYCKHLPKGRTGRDTDLRAENVTGPLSLSSQLEARYIEYVQSVNYAYWHTYLQKWLRLRDVWISYSWKRWMNEFLFHEPTIIGMVGIGADTTLRSSQPAPLLRLWRQQKYSAELKLTSLSIVTTEESRNGSCGKPTQSMEALRSLAHIERESNPQPLVHWPVSQPTEPHAHPNVDGHQLNMERTMNSWATYCFPDW